MSETKPVVKSAFPEFRAAAWPYKFHGTMHIGTLVGGTPTDPKVAEGWIKTKLGVQADEVVQQAVAKVMAETGSTVDEAAKTVADDRHLNAFKRDPEKGLYIEGRQLKSAIREAASVAYAVGKILNDKGNNSWGRTGKGIHGFAAEHIQVVDDRIYLERLAADNVAQKFVHTFHGSGIQYEETVSDVELHFTVQSDYDFSREFWAMLWLTGEYQGLGAARSQGFGRYTITEWEQFDVPAPKPARKAPAKKDATKD